MNWRQFLISKGLWWLHGLVFVCLLTTPLWLRRDFQYAPRLVHAALFDLDSFSSKVAEDTISSRVVKIPWPGATSELPTVEVATKQFRFSLEERPKAVRQPATKHNRKKVSEPQWRLATIQRRISNVEWEQIPLAISDELERATPNGSVYVELNEGLNEFLMTFRDARGRTTAYPLTVKLSENNGSK